MSKSRIIFFGTPDFSVPALEALHTSGAAEVAAVVTQPDRPAGRGQKLRASPVKEAAVSHGIPVLQPLRIKRHLSEFLNEARAFGPFDLGVVIAFGQILPREVLDLPRLGCVNIHASILPRWRGAAPIQRAIMAGDAESGVCLMQMDEGLDTGPVLACEKTAITNSMTAGELHDSLAQLGAKTLLTHLPAILARALPPIPQPPDGITYAAKIGEAEAEVRWDAPAQQVSRHINGLSPYPGAFTYLHGQRLKLLRAEPQDDSEAEPGTLTGYGSAGLLVATAAGQVKITEIQLEGRKRMAAADFIRGTPLTTGVRLGR